MIAMVGGKPLSPGSLLVLGLLIICAVVLFLSFKDDT